MFQQENVRSQLSVVVLGVQMGIPLMRTGAGRNCHSMLCQLAVLKRHREEMVMIGWCMCVFEEEGVVGGCEEFPVELIIPILTYESGGWAGSRGGGGGGGMLRL